MSAVPVPPPSSSSDTSFRARRRATHRVSPAVREGRQHPTQRSQRAVWACERCRAKKLRCTGGHPCSACRRAEAECDLGHGGPALEHSDSFLNQRLLQLESTLSGLVARLGEAAQPPPSANSLETRTFPVSQSQNQGIPSYAHLNERTRNPLEGASLPSLVQTAYTTPSSIHVQSNGALPAQSHQPSTRPEDVVITPTGTNAAEEVSSRWAALAQNPAPFPALMLHPAVWSGEAVRSSPEDSNSVRPAPGLNHYRANVHLDSEPISENIVGEETARALFDLFFDKCHPLYPLLDPCIQCYSHFDHVRSSSTFLFTAILAIASRYHASCRRTQSTPPSRPLMSATAIDALANLACAHLGLALFRKQHQLSDIQATLLLSVWIPRGNGESADQWMTVGLCIRLAHRIGIPRVPHRLAAVDLLRSPQPNALDVREIQELLPQWHTWLMIIQYDTSLSLGFGRPHTMALTQAAPRQFLEIVRRYGDSAQVTVAAATHAASLAELTMIAADLVTGFSDLRLQSSQGQMTAQSASNMQDKIVSLLCDLNPRLDEWQRQWTWSGSYDAIALGNYLTLVKIYGEHTRLCLNSLSLNLTMSSVEMGARQNQTATSCLAQACEAAVSLVQCYVGSPADDSPARYGGDYLVLTLGQTATFLIRVLVARLEQPPPIHHLVLRHYLDKAIKILESNDVSTTHICAWVARMCRDIARHAGVTLEADRIMPRASLGIPYSDPSGLEWDFDVSAILGVDIPACETGLDLGHYFDFARPYLPQPPNQ